MSKQPLVFGVLNVTPDSFSDGGEWLSPDVAIAHAENLVREGAHVIDVGGESTRPGAERLDPSEEWRRVHPVITALIERNIPVSLDTMNASTAAAGIELGVQYINDVSGGLADPAMVSVVADSGATFIIMHGGGFSATMDSQAHYRDVTREVTDALRARVDSVVDAGCDAARVWLDPGLGFAKTPEHNWQLLRDLPQLVALGYPVMVGASRKRFLAPFSDVPQGRDSATAVISVLAAESGAAAVRVHNTAATSEALRVRALWRGE